MALVYIEDSDPWLSEYDACEKLFREIMEQLTARNRHSKTSQAYASLSVNIRIRLKQYNREVQQLKSKVDEALRSKAITIEEAERRTRQIEILQSKDVQLQKLYDARTSDFATSRSNLLSTKASAFADGGTTSWAADDDDEKPIDVQVSVANLATQHEQILQEQDRGLEELHKVIVRQKEIGQTISNEVEYQNEIIDNLADHMDRTDDSIVNKTRRIERMSFKDRTCGYWIVIIFLFICIVTVALV
ncbi:syntaxin-8 [Hylaeus anthracinus]|uniref:syntaxin-8 n=1 Tax=Hylaeus volcanicus TaxID=313075 RepID=UPI0023B8702E|nr:syntaxin-8 [Hylaeus volcanicus]XP_054011912.1 syntaxin-8 [Hylaeus anthracinus]